MKQSDPTNSYFFARSSKRIWTIFIFFLFVTIIIIFRISWLSLTGIEKDEKSGTKKTVRRGQIYDIRKNLLAFSEERFNIFFDGRKPAPNTDTINEVVNISGIDHKTIQGSIDDTKVILINRYVSKSLALEYQLINDPSILIERVEQRFYPENELLAQTLGFVGNEGIGLAGLEHYYNNLLNHTSSQFREKRLTLNIDSGLQKVLEQKLRSAIEENQAKTGVILIQEVKTGRMVSMVQYPLFDLNQFRHQKKEIFRNLAANSIVEPGSIFKIFFIAYLIDKFDFPLDKTVYDCKGHYELVNGEVIKDNGVHGKVSISDIIKYSCNSGLIYLSERLNRNEMYRFLKQFKINEKLEIDLPGEWWGILPKVNEWGLRTKATIPIGQGIAMTPLNLINGFTSLIGNGYLFSPKIVNTIETYEVNELIDSQEVEPKVFSKVITDQTSRKVIDLLVQGTIKGSTGYASRVTGFEKVFGKTATSQLVNKKEGGYYIDRYHSMFAGGYPSRDPLFSILVIITEPKKEYYGGRVAAPLFAQAVEELIRFYKLPEERMVEKINNTFFLDTNYDELISERFLDQIPDFTGLTFKRALKLVEDFKTVQKSKRRNVRYKIEGSGFVTKQSPPPYSRVDDVVNIRLLLK